MYMYWDDGEILWLIKLKFPDQRFSMPVKSVTHVDLFLIKIKTLFAFPEKLNI